VGLGATQTYYEVACKDGAGYILQVPLKTGGPTISATPAWPSPDSKVKCT